MALQGLVERSIALQRKPRKGFSPIKVDNLWIMGGRELWYYNCYNMEAKWIHKIIKVGTSYAVILPPSLLRELKWEYGQAVVVTGIMPQSIKLTLLTNYLQSLENSPAKKDLIKLK